MSMPEKVYMNGRVVEARRANVSVYDRGLLYGDGLIETMRAYRGRVFCLDEHLERLHNGANTLGIPTAPLAGIESGIERLIKANRLGGNLDAYLRITLTRGVDKHGYRPKKDPKPTVIITARALDKKKIGSMQRGGVKATLTEGRSLAIGGLKTLNYLPNVLAASRADENNAFEALFTSSGIVTEGSSSNLFIIKNNMLKTPPLGPRKPQRQSINTARGGSKAAQNGTILPGITRQLVIKLASKLGIKVRESRVSIEELKRSDEAFITNSIIEILPLIDVDGAKISRGKRGKATESLQTEYGKEVG